MNSLEGLLVAAFGRQYQVELPNGENLLCFPRGKKSVAACGDRITLERTAHGQGVITRIEPRQSLLYRSDIWKQKLIAANANQIVVVVAVQPSFAPELVSRCVVAAEHEGIRVVLALNKVDIAAGLEAARVTLEPFARLGYPVVELSARQSIEPLRSMLAGRISVLVGQSGMGKSTIVNTLVPEAAAATREISAALDSGKHTTTYTRLYRLQDGAAIIDSPGVQEFGLAHLSRGEVEHGFAEFRALLGACRFRDCWHDAEPDCALKAAVEAGTIARTRFEHYRAICASLPSGSRR